MIAIRPVTPADHLDVSVLVTSVFRQPNEARLLEALRAEERAVIELLAADEDGPVGHALMATMVAPEGWLTLGPVCVRPQNAGTGVGTALIIDALDQARQAGFEAAVVLGDPGYYKRFGFVFGGDITFITPYPAEYTGFYWFGAGPITAGPCVELAYPDAFTSA